MWGSFSDEMTSLSFTIAAGPRQHIRSWVRVPRGSWSCFTLSDSRLPQPGGPGPRSYIPQGQGEPVIPPGTGFPFRRLLRLARLRWKYSDPPPRGNRNCDLNYGWLCPLITPWHGSHGKHRLLLSAMRVYLTVTWQWMFYFWLLRECVYRAVA
jgi:hypothetical protein